MRVFMKVDGKLLLLQGPGDVAGRVGELWLDGDKSELATTRWAVPLGLFAARGGSVRWLV